MTTGERTEDEGQDLYAPGRNQVEVKPLGGRGGYYRSYEIYQRQRLKDSQHEFNPRLFLRTEYLLDPYPYVNKLRELYESYRDWVNNCDSITRYNDVTSVFSDDANFETRPKLWFYGKDGYGRDLGHDTGVMWAWANGVETAAPSVCRDLIAAFAADGSADLVGDFTFPYHAHLVASVLGLPREDWPRFTDLFRAMMDGWQWDPVRETQGKSAITDFTALVSPHFAARRLDPGSDLISAIARHEPENGPPTSPEDVTATVLEIDGDTLMAGLANSWFHLLTKPEQLETITAQPMLVKRAWQEMLRHSTPVLHARRFARHEVERFGRLIPEGGLVMLSAAAANRDPRIFDNPDTFDVRRKDLCFREPRGSYRADGLAAGVAFGMGTPSKHPAVPEDRPRSVYAITQDVAVVATRALIAALPNVRLAPDAEPRMFCRWPWDIHTCWDLPVVFDPA